MSEALTQAYSQKTVDYFHGVRRYIIDDLPAGRQLTVLEIGCGGGATLAFAKSQGKAARIVGVEIHPQAAAVEFAGFKVVWVRPLAPMTTKQKLANALTLNLFPL